MVVVLLGSLAQRISSLGHDGRCEKERRSSAGSIGQGKSESVVIQAMRSIEHGGASSASGPRSP